WVKPPPPPCAATCSTSPPGWSTAPASASSACARTTPTRPTSSWPGKRSAHWPPRRDHAPTRPDQLKGPDRPARQGRPRVTPGHQPGLHRARNPKHHPDIKINNTLINQYHDREKSGPA